MFYLQNAAEKNYNGQPLSNLWYGKCDLLPENEVNAVFSTRLGGVSKGVYQSLNLALHVGDEKSDVIENRQRFCAAADFDFAKLTTAQQCHSDRVAVVTKADAGRGHDDFADGFPDVDALITDVPGVPLAVFVADCASVLLYDPVKKAVAAVHAGWRGTLDAIAARTVEKMVAVYNSNPADTLAVIGPSIGVQDYEVGEDVSSLFIERYGEKTALAEGFIVRGKYAKDHLDIWAVNRYVLEKAGLKSQNIECADVSTDENNAVFFSFRHDDGNTGRLAVVIALK